MRVGLLDLLAPARLATPAEPVAVDVRLSEADPIAVPGDAPTTTSRLLDAARAGRVAKAIALSIPSVRKAQAVLTTIATFELAAWDAQGRRLPAEDPRARWLRQPEPRRTRFRTISKTVQDIIWEDRSVWRAVDTTLFNTPVGFERLHPDRIQTIDNPLDPDTVDTWIIDSTDTPESKLLIFDGAGLGGLSRYGYELLTIYGDLQTAAGRYARVPHPYAILKNSGADLEHDEIVALLDKWEAARGERGVGYLNSVMDYEPQQGFSARELQLVEAREHAAVEVARLFGLPAFALDAKGGDSMTYSNVTERRRDLVEALRPWMSVVEESLSLDDRSSRPRGVVLPAGIVARFDAAAYIRDDPKTRMETWNAALANDVLDLDEVRANEPLARS